MVGQCVVVGYQIYILDVVYIYVRNLSISFGLDNDKVLIIVLQVCGGVWGWRVYYLYGYGIQE